MVAIHVLGQHDQMVGTLVLAALAVKTARSGHIELRAHNRLERRLLVITELYLSDIQSFLLRLFYLGLQSIIIYLLQLHGCFVQELLGREHIAVVSNSQGRLTVSHGSIDQVFYLGLTVQNRILGISLISSPQR